MFEKLVISLQLLRGDLLARFEDDEGATATEYGLLVGLIALIIVVGVGLFGTALNKFFSDLATTVNAW